LSRGIQKGFVHVVGILRLGLASVLFCVVVCLYRKNEKVSGVKGKKCGDIAL
jgi:hypothetical protein